MRTRDLMEVPPSVVQEDTTIDEAASTMWEGNIGSVIVVDKAGVMVGILTERDVLFSVTKSLTGKGVPPPWRRGWEPRWGARRADSEPGRCTPAPRRRIHPNRLSACKLQSLGKPSGSLMPIYEFECEGCGIRFEELVPAKTGAWSARFVDPRRPEGCSRCPRQPLVSHAVLGSIPMNRSAVNAEPRTKSASRRQKQSVRPERSLRPESRRRRPSVSATVARAPRRPG